MPDAQPTHTRRKVLILIFLLAAITYVDRLLMSAAAPFIVREFGFTPTQLGVIFSAFTLCYALFEVPSGWWGDSIGTRKVLTRIVLCWSAFTMLTGAATGFWSLLVIRMLFGAGEAGAFPNIARSVSLWFPAAEQGRAMTASFLGLAVGSSLTVPLLFPLIQVQGWRIVFVECGFLGVLWCVVWYRWFRDRPEDHPEVNAAEARVISEGRAPGALATHRVPWARAFRSRNLWAICGAYFPYGYGLYFYITWLPIYLIKGRGFSPEYASWFSALPWVFAAAAMFLGGWLTDLIRIRTGNLKLARNALAIAGYTGSALMLLAVTMVADKVAAALLLACAAFFQMSAAPPCWTTCIDTGRSKAGVVSGFMNTVGNIGGTLAPIIMGVAVERWGSWNQAFYISAALFGFGVVMWLFVDPRKPIFAEDEG